MNQLRQDLKKDKIKTESIICLVLLNKIFMKDESNKKKIKIT